MRWTAVLLGTLGVFAGARPARAQDVGSYQLTLGDAARLAAERSAPVLEAHSRVEGAWARVRQSTSALLPTLDASVIRGARTFNTASFGLDFPAAPGQEPFFDPAGEVVGPVRSADVRASAQVPLLDLAAFGRRRSALAGADAAMREEEAVADQAGAQAAMAYVSDIRARAEVEAREQDLGLARELLGVAQGLLDAGVAVALDVTRAQSQVVTIQAQLLSARHRADIAELALRRALRLPADATLELVDDLASATGSDTVTEEEATARALDARSDLATARAYRTAATEGLSAVKAGRLPRLSISADEGTYGKRFGHMLNTYSWNLRLSVPLFDGMKRSAQIQEEEARIHEMDFRIEDLEADVAFQVRQALLNLSAAREQADAADERLRLAQLEVDQEEERVRAGVSGTADVVRAAMRLNEARTARLDVLSALQAARVALAAASGTVTELP
jgi:outer membrane protein TolC